MPRADKGPTKPRADDQSPMRKQQPGAQGAGRERDAIDEDGNVDRQKLKDNQEQLQVGEDHKTPDMKKQRRGTYP
jgi:hypothetical protein